MAFGHIGLVTVSAPRAIARPDLTEKQFTSRVKELAELFGWRRYHTWTSVHSAKGFPDEVLVRGERIIFAELKSEKGKLTEPQTEWLNALRASGRVEVYVWRPSEWDEIVGILR